MSLEGHNTRANYNFIIVAVFPPLSHSALTLLLPPLLRVVQWARRRVHQQLGAKNFRNLMLLTGRPDGAKYNGIAWMLLTGRPDGA